MAVKDYTQHFDGLREGGSALPTPNTVSRVSEVGDRSFQTVVWQSGKAVLDSELLLGQDAAWWDRTLFRQWQTQSGWMRGVTHFDSATEYTFGQAPLSVSDDSGAILILPDQTLINSFLLPRLEAVVAGRPLVVEYTNTRTPGWNLVQLSPATAYDGTSGTIKRTDFAFLEVWLSLVAPSPRASGTVQVVDSSALIVGDLITIDGLNLTAAAAPALNSFVFIAGDEAGTASNLADAVNDPANAFATTVSARLFGDTVLLESVEAGAVGNGITLSVTVGTPGALLASGATLTGGEDRYSKPEQDKLYRHGNVLSPSPVWLADELIDPVIRSETTQRVQLQYRIRVTDETQGVNYKKHPDGFSAASAGPAPIILAQGGTSAPVSGYPFVPADRTSIWLDSSAVQYDREDGGLWVAGDGSKDAAKALGALDGFVYAIPICFLHRHNDSSTAAPGFQGFDPVSNTNAAPCYEHSGFTGPLGVIPAGASDRPDGHYCDVVETTRLVDLRRHVILSGFDASRELQAQLQSLFDGTNLTWSVDTASMQKLGGSSGDVSTQHLICNEVGRSNAHDGNNSTSGDTDRGEFVRDFDHLARRFGDQGVVERVVFAFYPGDRSVGPAVAPGLVNPGKYVTKAGGSPGDEWAEGDTLHLDLTLLNATTLGGVFQGLDGGGTSFVTGFTPSIAEFAPPGTTITDVLGVFHDDGLYSAPVSQATQVRNIQGLGSMHLQLTLDANPTTASDGLPVAMGNPLHSMVVSAPNPGSKRRIFVEVEVTYPIGEGLTDTPNFQLTPDGTVYNGSKGSGQAPGPGSLVENEADQRPNDFEALLPPAFRDTFREVMLEYVANDTISHNPGLKNSGSPVGAVTAETIVSASTSTLKVPRRLFGSVTNLPSVVDAAIGAPKVIDHGHTEYGSSTRLVTVTTPLSGAGHTQCEVTYFPQDPIPNYGVLGGGYQISVYFRSAAPQTAGVKEGDITTGGDGVLPTTLNVEPLFMGSTWTGQIGSGSPDRAYPYGQPFEHIPVNDELAATTHEWFFCATTNIAVSDFNAATGLLQLHPYTPVDTQNVLQFGGLGVTQRPRVDAEFRAFYPFAADWVYRPTVLSQPLAGAVRHKVVYPILGRIVEEVHGTSGNGILFRKNEVVLIVLTRFAELDEDNTIRFADTQNTTCAGIYRTKNLLLVVGDRVQSVPPAP